MRGKTDSSLHLSQSVWYLNIFPLGNFCSLHPSLGPLPLSAHIGLTDARATQCWSQKLSSVWYYFCTSLPVFISLRSPCFIYFSASFSPRLPVFMSSFQPQIFPVSLSCSSVNSTFPSRDKGRFVFLCSFQKYKSEFDRLTELHLLIYAMVCLFKSKIFGLKI